MRREQRQQISEALSSLSPDLVKDLVKETRGRIEKKINPSPDAPRYVMCTMSTVSSRVSPIQCRNRGREEGTVGHRDRKVRPFPSRTFAR